MFLNYNVLQRKGWNHAGFSGAAGELKPLLAAREGALGDRSSRWATWQVLRIVSMSKEPRPAGKLQQQQAPARVMKKKEVREKEIRAPS